MDTDLNESEIHQATPLLLKPDSDFRLTPLLEGRDLKALMTHIKTNLSQSKKRFRPEFSDRLFKISYGYVNRYLEGNELSLKEVTTDLQTFKDHREKAKKYFGAKKEGVVFDVWNAFRFYMFTLPAQDYFIDKTDVPIFTDIALVAKFDELLAGKGLDFHVLREDNKALAKEILLMRDQGMSPVEFNRLMKFRCTVAPYGLDNEKAIIEKQSSPTIISEIGTVLMAAGIDYRKFTENPSNYRELFTGIIKSYREAQNVLHDIENHFSPALEKDDQETIDFEKYESSEPHAPNFVVKDSVRVALRAKPSTFGVLLRSLPMELGEKTLLPRHGSDISKFDEVITTIESNIDPNFNLADTVQSAFKDSMSFIKAKQRWLDAADAEDKAFLKKALGRLQLAYFDIGLLQEAVAYDPNNSTLRMAAITFSLELEKKGISYKDLKSNLPLLASAISTVIKQRGVNEAGNFMVLQALIYPHPLHQEITEILKTKTKKLTSGQLSGIRTFTGFIVNHLLRRQISYEDFMDNLDKHRLEIGRLGDGASFAATFSIIENDLKPLYDTRRQNSAAGIKRTFSEAEVSGEENPLAILRNEYAPHLDQSRFVAAWAHQEDGSRLLALYEKSDDDKIVPLLDAEGGPLQLSEDDLSNLPNLELLRNVKRVRAKSPSDRNEILMENADDGVIIKKEPEDEPTLTIREKTPIQTEFATSVKTMLGWDDYDNYEEIDEQLRPVRVTMEVSGPPVPMKDADAMLGVRNWRQPHQLEAELQNPKDKTGKTCHDDFEVLKVEFSDADEEWLLMMSRKKNPELDAAIKKLEIAKAAYDRAKGVQARSKTGEEWNRVKADTKPVIDNFFEPLKEELKHMWNERLKRGLKPEALEHFEPKRLTNTETKVTALQGKFGLVCHASEDVQREQLVDHFVFPFPSGRIRVGDFDSLGEYIDIYGKEQFERYAATSSPDEEGKMYYWVPVGTGAAASFINDEKPKIVDGKIVSDQDHPRGEMRMLEPIMTVRVGKDNVFKIQPPQIYQNEIIPPNTEGRMSYANAKWEDLDREPDENDYTVFYDKIKKDLDRTDVPEHWEGENKRNLRNPRAAKIVLHMVEKCEEVAAQTESNGRNPHMLAGDTPEQRERWRNWCIKGFKITVGGKPLTVLVSFTDSSGKLIDDLQIVPPGKSAREVFEKMRHDALYNRVGKKTKELLAFSPKLSLQVQIKQQPEDDDIVMSNTRQRALPVRSSRTTRSTSASVSASKRSVGGKGKK